MKLLAINIPTYERFHTFCSVLMSINNSLNLLNNDDRDKILINIVDNNSNSYENKKEFIEKLDNAHLYSIFKNPSNIGGDLNILKCALLSRNNTIYTWILGDDDPIALHSLNIIVPILKRKLYDIVICGHGDNYNKVRNEGLTFNSYPNYFKHLLVKGKEFNSISHTLISCNIFKSKIFDESYALYCLNNVTKRSNLTANFCHMYGILGGSFANDVSPILIINEPVLQHSTREEFEVDISEQIKVIYAQYLIWLCFNCGVSVSSLASLKSKALLYNFWWIYEFRNRLHMKFSKLIYKLLGAQFHGKLKKIWNKS